MTKEVRVRYAPSPTGNLHIGGARTALFNYLYARHHNGKFIVRIEDTDIERNIEGGELSQLDNLKWLGMEYDESVDIGGPYEPYRQMERLDIYTKYAEEMLEKGHAYKCFCSSEELEADREQQKKKVSLLRCITENADIYRKKKFKRRKMQAYLTRFVCVCLKT